MLGLAMAITPFVNNATTAVVLAPIAVELARADGVSPALTLMAVAIGASSDFLTPFGHHNNTLAYGLGGYRFRDFPRTGWPVSRRRLRRRRPRLRPRLVVAFCGSLTNLAANVNAGLEYRCSNEITSLHNLCNRAS